MAQSLAREFDCPWVPEFSRSYLQHQGTTYDESDLEKILLGQMESENSARRASNSPYLFVDTGPEVVYIWSLYKYGRVSHAIAEATATQQYNLTLLMAPDIGWSPDPLRENASLTEREELYHMYETLLCDIRRDYRIVSGKESMRHRNAVEILRQSARG
tara:strand:- start:5586 stop:6062 length:477 start_codon:yes stop_codon:yes gene_type:complete